MSNQINQRVVYENDEGGVSVLIPSPNALKTTTLEAMAAKSVPAGKAWRIVDVSEIPTDRTFRNAWKSDLTVDMPKARGIHRDHMRQARKPKLEALDVAMIRAMEDGDSARIAVIKAKKQALRDVTADPAIDAAATPDTLKAVWPAALEDESA